MPRSKTGTNDFRDPNYWLQHAQSDLNYAGVRAKGILPEQRCFHAQQAAEKALKAVYVAHDIPFQLTHSINTLFRGLQEAGVDIPAKTAAAKDLTLYAAETRYPSLEKIPPSRPEREIPKARAVLQWAKKEVARLRKSKTS